MGLDWDTTPPPRQRDCGLWGLVAVTVAIAGGVGVSCVVFRFVLGPDSLFAGPAVVSPDGRYAARVIESNCGALCSFDARVLVSDLTRYSSQSSPRTTVLRGNAHPCSILLRWVDDRTLVIVIPSEAEMDDLTSDWEGVEVLVEQRQAADAEVAQAYGVQVVGGCYQQWFIRR